MKKVLVCIMVSATVLVLGQAAVRGWAAEVQDAPRACFPASKWGDGSGGLSAQLLASRPCVKITRVYEDGSFRYKVTDVDGTPRYAGGVGAKDR